MSGENTMSTLLKRGARIGKFVAENGPAKAVRHFSDRKLPESTARRFKLEYLSALKDKVSDHENGVFRDTPPEVTALPTKAQGRPLLLGKELDNIVQEYIKSTRKAKGVVNSCYCRCYWHSGSQGSRITL